jgi:tRNA(fMet)-specific endonuclease VapC
MRRWHAGWKHVTTFGSARGSGRIKAGFYGGIERRRNEILLNRLLAKPTVGILLPARETAEQYARLFVLLRRAGTPVPDNDLWITALALEHDLILITRDNILSASRNCCSLRHC